MNTMKTLNEIITEELAKFDEKFSPQIMNEDICLECRINFKELKSFLRQMAERVAKAERTRLLAELLEKGHGGGNWRRLIEQMRDRQAFLDAYKKVR